MRAILIAFVVLAVVAFASAQSNFTGPACYSRYVSGCQQELETCLNWGNRPSCTCYGLTMQCLWSLGCASEDLTNACYTACGEGDASNVCIINSAAFSGVSFVLVMAAALLALFH
jgi:hypothetical protein